MVRKTKRMKSWRVRTRVASLYVMEDEPSKCSATFGSSLKAQSRGRQKIIIRQIANPMLHKVMSLFFRLSTVLIRSCLIRSSLSCARLSSYSALQFGLFYTITSSRRTQYSFCQTLGRLFYPNDKTYFRHLQIKDMQL